MTTRSRVLAFGAAGALVLAGVVSAVLVPGLTGQLLALASISFGLAGVVLLLFLEVGLSDDRARWREAERRRRARTEPLPPGQRRRRSLRAPRRPG